MSVICSWCLSVHIGDPHCIPHFQNYIRNLRRKGQIRGRRHKSRFGLASENFDTASRRVKYCTLQKLLLRLAACHVHPMRKNRHRYTAVTVHHFTFTAAKSQGHSVTPKEKYYVDIVTVVFSILFCVGFLLSYSFVEPQHMYDLQYKDWSQTTHLYTTVCLQLAWGANTLVLCCMAAFDERYSTQQVRCRSATHWWSRPPGLILTGPW